MKSRKTIFLMIYLASLLLWHTLTTTNYQVVAQAPDDLDEVLIFYKRLPTGDKQIVSIGNGMNQHINLAERQCFKLSHRKDRVAIVDMDEPKTVTFFRLDGTLELSVAWENRESWNMPCSFSWNEDDSLLSVYVKYTVLDEWGVSFEGFYTIDTTYGNIVGPSEQISKYCPSTSDMVGYYASITDMTCAEFAAQVPNLPTNAFFMVSPDANFVVYDRCINGQVYWNEWTKIEECDGPNETAIYDLRRQELVEILVDGPDLVRDRRNGHFSQRAHELSWSPSGRYLAYQVFNPSGVNVFDVQSHQYWSPIAVDVDSYFFSAASNVYWSPDEHKLAFTLHSEESDNYLGVVFDTETSTLKPTNVTLSASSGSLWWSPDSQTIAFISGGTLFLWDINTGELTRLDDNVVNILGWVSE